MRYTVPMPEDSLIPGGATEKVALDGAVLPIVKNGGLDGLEPTTSVLSEVVSPARCGALHDLPPALRGRK